MQADLYNMAGEVIGVVELADDVFGADINAGLVHQAVVRQLANARQGTADTKRRGEVAGTGKKVYRQKGTGRARQGQARAPHWRKGGVVFGPHPRSYSQDLPRKMRRAALRGALSDKLAETKIRVVDQIGFSEPKTREAAAFFRALQLDESTLVVMPASDQMVVRAVRNLEGADIVPADLLNTVEVVSHQYLVMPVEAVRRLEARLGAGADKAEV